MTEQYILQTPVVHNPTCPTSGAYTCQDYMHRKENWTREDLNLLIKILDNYFPDVRQAKTL